MKVYLFDTEYVHSNLLPLSFTRPVAAFRSGILTIKEKWEKELGEECFYLPVAYLQENFGRVSDEDTPSLYIIGNLLPRQDIVESIRKLKTGESIVKNGTVIAFMGLLKDFSDNKFTSKEFEGELKQIHYVFDLFLLNYEEISEDFKRITHSRESSPLPSCTGIFSLDRESKESRIFVEQGATVECASLNVKNGPIYIGKDVHLMEGACLRGPVALCEGAEVRMGARIYGGTTIGPYCKVGGEIDNSVIFGYTNKAHDGYLGNAVIGEWCNIGAGVNASNLKNDYSMIKIWNYHKKSFMKTDLQFCGLIMGDHSKIGVNCMINTATVVGVGVNIHGAGFPRAFLNNFSEGSPSGGFSRIPYKKFSEVAERVMARRDVMPKESYKKVYEEIYNNCEVCE